MDEPLLEKQFSYFKRSYVQFKKEKTYLIIYVFKQTNYQNVKKINWYDAGEMMMGLWWPVG